MNVPVADLRMNNFYNSQMFLRVALAILGASCLVFSDARAEKILLRIRVGNPIETPQKKEVKSNLPEGVATNEVLSAGGLDLGYDVQNDIYYVHKEIELGPKEIKIFDVEINDVWNVDGEEMDKLLEHTDNLVKKLKRTDLLETAEELRKQIADDLEFIKANQERNSIKAGAKAIDHIRAHEANLRLLGRAKQYVGRLENLVLGTNQDTGDIMGDVTTENMEPQAIMPSDEYKVVVVRVTVRNTSPTEKRLIAVKRELPPEIVPDDVLDAGGLDVATDPKSGVCYVYKDKVEVEPGKTIVFDVKIKDKWNINAARTAKLKETANEILDRVKARQKFKSVEEKLLGFIASIEEIEKETGPETLSDKYVAFYRQQRERLNLIEHGIRGIERRLRPIEKTTRYGFKVKPPSMKTTWMIIYIILGFLAVISLLFFLRWFGKTKAEKMTAAIGSSSDETRAKGE